MSTAKRGGSEGPEVRLRLAEDRRPAPIGHAGVGANSAPCYTSPALQEQHAVQQQQPHARGPFPPGRAAPAPSYRVTDSPSRVFDCPSIQITSIQPSAHQAGPPAAHDQLYLPLESSYRDASALCPSPGSSLSSRSWLSDASSCESFSHVYDDVEAELNEAAAGFRLDSPLVSPLGSPLASPQASPQASPLVSPLVSPFGSPGYAFRDEPWLHSQQGCLYALSPHQSPCQSPRTSVTEDTWLSPRPHSSSRPSSRPTSPYGKRPHSSAEAVPGCPSPHLSPCPSPTRSPRGSVVDDTWWASPSPVAAAAQACVAEVDVPSKTRRTYQPQHGQDRTSLLPAGWEDHGPSLSPALDSSVEMSLPCLKKEDIVEHFLSVPPPFAWGKPKPTHTPLFRATSLPTLDCPLPSQYGQIELKLEVQPKPHHRAHYETEGSRGAIKSACGRHPVVKLIGYSEKPVSMQMFVGTADDRHTRPHAFYQVHRITGKTVGTPSHEMVIASTKVLEIPLLPENDMLASIDCAGILKLRNADIELRKGETDIGRKNTRVRAVFRVQLPQPGGKVLCLQVASVPIECSQRSAQELPHVETFSPPCGSAAGGEEMLISGPNITPDSKVIFLEKGPDGRTQWEVDAKPVCEKSRDTSIVVKIPSYHKRTLLSSMQVQFYVSNGKRKRSPPQTFTYVSNPPNAVQVKQEFAGPGDSAACRVTNFPVMPGAQQAPELLEQWLYSGGPVCVPSSAPHCGYSPLDNSFLDQLRPQDCSLGAEHGLYAVSPTSSLDFSKPSLQGPQQSLSYNGEPGLPSNWAPVHGSKSSPLASAHVTSLLGIGHGGCPGGVRALNQSSSQGCTEGYLSFPSVSHQHEPSSPGHHKSGHDPVDVGQFQSSSPVPESPVLQQSPASALVPSTLSLNGEAFTDPRSNSPSLPAAVASGSRKSGTSQCCSSVEHRLNITQEPGEDKELTFQSIGLQDITLDDVSEIIGRDLFRDPDSAGDGHSLFHKPD